MNAALLPSTGRASGRVHKAASIIIPTGSLEDLARLGVTLEMFLKQKLSLTLVVCWLYKIDHRCRLSLVYSMYVLDDGR